MPFRYLLIIAFLLQCITVHGTESDSTAVVRPVSSFYSLEAGSSHITDTYLSPIKYSGWGVAFGYERTQAMKFAPERWVMQMKAGVAFDRVLNQVKNRDMLFGEVNFSWGMLHRWKTSYGLSFGVGGTAALNAGCLYLDRGGNNPASAKAAVTINAIAYASWQTKLGRIPVRLRYQPTLPLTGVFFAPDYGELYYEIYLGNHSGLVHAAHFGNYFGLDNMLTADFSFGSTVVRVGYHGRILSTNVNHTVTNVFNHSAVVGVGGEWISLNPSSKPSKAARIISATY